MAFYLVRARLKPDRATELYGRLTSGELRLLRPFGASLTAALLAARWDEVSQQVLWEELCYCNPPLAEEREQVLDAYFTDLAVQRVAQGEGVAQIAPLPLLWSREGSS